MTAVDMTDSNALHEIKTPMSTETKPRNTFITVFVPGLVLGLVVGLFSGAYFVPLLQSRLESGPLPQSRGNRTAAPATPEVPGSERAPGVKVPDPANDTPVDPAKSADQAKPGEKPEETKPANVPGNPK